MSESSYRRGYHQGYFSALEDVNVKYNLKTKELDIFMDKELYGWRTATGKDAKKIVVPPEYFITNKRKNKDEQKAIK